MSEASIADAAESDTGRGGLATLWRWGVVAALGVLVIGIGVSARTPPPIVGIVGALALGVVRYRLSTPYVVAVGQIAVVASLGGTPPGVVAVAAEATLLGGIAVPAGWSRRGRWTALAALVVLSVVGGLALGAHAAWETLWASALVAVGTGGLIGYGLHRYEQVRLQVVASE